MKKRNKYQIGWNAFALALAFSIPAFAEMDHEVHKHGEKAEVAAPASEYPLTTCVISGEKLGGMGKPYVFTYEGTEVQLCCQGCKKTFLAHPKKHVATIKAAKEKAAIKKAEEHSEHGHEGHEH